MGPLHLGERLDVVVREKRGPRSLITNDGRQLTLPQIFCRRVAKTPNQVAVRVQRYGIWEEWSWARLEEAVVLSASGFLELGISPGDRVGIVAGACYEALISTLALQAIGAVAFGISPSASLEAIDSLAAHARCRHFVVEGSQTYQTLMAVSQLTPLSALVLVRTPVAPIVGQRGVHHTWQQLTELGAVRHSRLPAEWAELVSTGTPDDVCGLYSTTSFAETSRWALLTHRQLLSAWLAPFEPGPDRVSPLSQADRTFHDVPAAYVIGLVFGLLYPVVFGCVAHIPDRASDLRDALCEVSPTVYLCQPHLWEERARQAAAALQTGGGVGGFAYRAALGARRRADLGRSGHGLWRVLGAVGRRVVFGPMLAKLGLAHLHLAVSYGDDLSPSVAQLWHLWGIEIRQAYGPMECGGLATLQRESVPRAGFAGRALPGVELRIEQDGEILLRGETVFGGYLDPEAGANTIDREGWFHTGDFGELLPDDNLRIRRYRQADRPPD
jgi:long-chain acyl-CoA synthetase